MNGKFDLMNQTTPSALAAPMAKRIFTITLLICLCSGLSKSQELFDLSSCIKAGLEQNFSILIARNQEKIASNNYTVGNAGYLPTLSGSGRYGGTINTTHQSFTDGSESETNGVNNTSGVVGVDLNMTIFNGFKVKATYQKLNEMKQLGILNTQLEMENLAAEIASEYFFFIQQLNLYNNMAYAVELSHERVRIDEERYLLGSSSKVDLLQSIVYLNSDSSRFAKQKEVLRASQVRLFKLMGNVDLGYDIRPKDTAISINDGLLYDDLLASTMDQNTSLQIARRNTTISQYDYKIIASRSYPYLNLTSGYDYSFNDYETGTVKSQQIHGLSYGLTLGVDIFDGFNRKRERTNAAIEIENREHEYSDVVQGVKADLLTIYYAYQNNLKLLKLEEQNLSVARENLEIAMERYRLGDLSGLELREVQKSLLDAEERLISVKFQAKLAEISLFQISGKIMSYL